MYHLRSNYKNRLEFPFKWHLYDQRYGNYLHRFPVVVARLDHAEVDERSDQDKHGGKPEQAAEEDLRSVQRKKYDAVESDLRITTSIDNCKIVPEPKTI